MDIIIEKENTPAEPKVDMFAGISQAAIDEANKAPGSEARQQQNNQASTSPAPGLDDGKSEAQRLIDEFKAGSVSPEVKDATEKLLDDKPLSSFHASLLNSGAIETWMVKVLSWGYVNFNVLVYNLIFSGKKKVIKSDIEMDRQDKLMLEKICHDYAPKLMEYLKKINPIVLTLVFMEGNIIAQMNAKAITIEAPKDKDPFKKS